MQFTINGERREVAADLRTSLLDLLRDHLHLFGAKKGCNQGACGACTVLVDGERINSCLALAVQYQGREHHHRRRAWATRRLGLHPLQAGLHPARRLPMRLLHAGPDLCSAVAMAGEVARGAPSVVSGRPDGRRTSPSTHDEVRERMSGNLCRCGAYNGIVAAINRDLRPRRQDRTRRCEKAA